ncbi:MAG: monooxygenase [Hyphomicrobiaceae bacterium]
MTQVLTIVTYRLPEGTDREAAVQLFRDSIPRYMATEGLLRKNVLYKEGIGGGIYLWESREAAERAYSPEWVAYMTEKYDHPPELTYYETPITMDRQYNVVHDEKDIAEAAE